MKIVALTGAGVSAESGLGTFRDKGGLWERYDPMELATPEAFARDPATVQAFYNARRQNLLASQPNDAHRALARLEEGLPARGDELTSSPRTSTTCMSGPGSRRVLHMHGELLKARCLACGAVTAWQEDLGGEESARPATRKAGYVRKWSGSARSRSPWRRSGVLLTAADLFVAIGTSGSVYPAAGFVAERGGAATDLRTQPRTIRQRQPVRRTAVRKRHEVVPAWVDRVLAENPAANGPAKPDGQ